MILLVDAGNTRLKWGAIDPVHPERLEHVGSAPTDALDAWPAIVAAIGPRRVLASNVAGAAIGRRIEAAAAGAGVAAVEWVRSSAARCGVRNAYDAPERLGSDRFVALIGAWTRFRRAALVVNCGTATTLDVLDADGRFAGGAILPGLELMKRSLASNTAQLALLEGRHAATPRNTADAIETGCLEAQAGAIERMYRRAAPGAVCVVSGGAGERIVPLLDLPVEMVPNLTLEGLAAVAAGSPGAADAR
jgi:type III pantothenate kinase